MDLKTAKGMPEADWEVAEPMLADYTAHVERSKTDG